MITRLIDQLIKCLSTRIEQFSSLNIFQRGHMFQFQYIIFFKQHMQKLIMIVPYDSLVKSVSINFRSLLDDSKYFTMLNKQQISSEQQILANAIIYYQIIHSLIVVRQIIQQLYYIENCIAHILMNQHRSNTLNLNSNPVVITKTSSITETSSTPVAITEMSNTPVAITEISYTPAAITEEFTTPVTRNWSSFQQKLLEFIGKRINNSLKCSLVSNKNIASILTNFNSKFNLNIQQKLLKELVGNGIIDIAKLPILVYIAILFSKQRQPIFKTLRKDQMTRYNIMKQSQQFFKLWSVEKINYQVKRRSTTEAFQIQQKQASIANFFQFAFKNVSDLNIQTISNTKSIHPIGFDPRIIILVQFLHNYIKVDFIDSVKNMLSLTIYQKYQDRQRQLNQYKKKVCQFCLALFKLIRPGEKREIEQLESQIQKLLKTSAQKIGNSQFLQKAKLVKKKKPFSESIQYLLNSLKKYFKKASDSNKTSFIQEMNFSKQELFEFQWVIQKSLAQISFQYSENQIQPKHLQKEIKRLIQQKIRPEMQKFKNKKTQKQQNRLIDYDLYENFDDKLKQECQHLQYNACTNKKQPEKQANKKSINKKRKMQDKIQQKNQYLLNGQANMVEQLQSSIKNDDNGHQLQKNYQKKDPQLESKVLNNQIWTHFYGSKGDFIYKEKSSSYSNDYETGHGNRSDYGESKLRCFSKLDGNEILNLNNENIAFERDYSQIVQTFQSSQIYFHSNINKGSKTLNKGSQMKIGFNCETGQ